MTELNIWNYGHLLKNLVLKEMRARYCSSVLGMLWAMLIPLATILVYLLAFKFILRINIQNYPVFITLGILPWNFFSTAIIGSNSSVISNAKLIKKIYFPREVLPCATVLFYFILFLMALIVFFPVAFLMGTRPCWPFVAYPFFLLLQLVFTIGVALVISATTVFYRDVREITEMCLMLLFWLTPIVYSLSSVPRHFQWLVKLNPLALFISAYQDIVYSSAWPPPETWLSCILWSVFMLVFGRWVFARFNTRFAEEL